MPSVWVFVETPGRHVVEGTRGRRKVPGWTGTEGQLYAALAALTAHYEKRNRLCEGASYL